MISVLLPVLVLAFGFAVGYGIREVIARRRRAAAREKFYTRSASNFEPRGMGKMTVNLEGDQAFSAAIAGLPKVAELIAALPAADRVRALEVVEESYEQTARTLGYEDSDARQWASAVMLQLRIVDSSSGDEGPASST
jgi:hypothetical protein